jgi:hypothetical protein
MSRVKVYRKYSGFDYLLSMAIGVLAFINVHRLQFYFAGRFNLGRLFLLFSLTYWIILLLIIYCLVLIAKRLLRHWQQDGMKNRLKGLLLFIFLVSVIVFAFSRRWRPFAVTYLRGFRQRMLVRADIPAIQVWLTEASDNKNGDTIPPSTWPPAVKKLSPDSFHFGIYKGVCYLTWNGPLGNQWGLVVGLPPMEIPEGGDVGRYTISMSKWDRAESFEAYVWFNEGM